MEILKRDYEEGTWLFELKNEEGNMFTYATQYITESGEYDDGRDNLFWVNDSEEDFDLLEEFTGCTDHKDFDKEIMEIM